MDQFGRRLSFVTGDHDLNAIIVGNQENIDPQGTSINALPLQQYASLNQSSLKRSSALMEPNTDFHTTPLSAHSRHSFEQDADLTPSSTSEVLTPTDFPPRKVRKTYTKELGKNIDVECVICFDTMSPQNSISARCSCKPKTCHYCPDCLTQWTRSAVEEVKIMKCNGDFELSFRRPQITKLLPKLLVHSYRDVYEQCKAVNAYFCASTECKAFIKSQYVKLNKNYAHCFKCKEKTCTTCRRLLAEHLGRGRMCPADAEDAVLDEAMAKFKYRKCPRCLAVVEKIDGCNNVRCKCKATFCYVCGEQKPSENRGLCKCMRDFREREAQRAAQLSENGELGIYAGHDLSDDANGDELPLFDDRTPRTQAAQAVLRAYRREAIDTQRRLNATAERTRALNQQVRAAVSRFEEVSGVTPAPSREHTDAQLPDPIMLGMWPRQDLRLPPIQQQRNLTWNPAPFSNRPVLTPTGPRDNASLLANTNHIHANNALIFPDYLWPTFDEINASVRAGQPPSNMTSPLQGPPLMQQESLSTPTTNIATYDAELARQHEQTIAHSQANYASGNENGTTLTNEGPTLDDMANMQSSRAILGFGQRTMARRQQPAAADQDTHQVPNEPSHEREQISSLRQSDPTQVDWHDAVPAVPTGSYVPSLDLFGGLIALEQRNVQAMARRHQLAAVDRTMGHDAVGPPQMHEHTATERLPHQIPPRVANSPPAPRISPNHSFLENLMALEQSNIQLLQRQMAAAEQAPGQVVVDSGYSMSQELRILQQMERARAGMPAQHGFHHIQPATTGSNGDQFANHTPRFSALRDHHATRNFTLPRVSFEQGPESYFDTEDEFASDVDDNVSDNDVLDEEVA